MIAHVPKVQAVLDAFQSLKSAFELSSEKETAITEKIKTRLGYQHLHKMEGQMDRIQEQF